jgi:hypothetical protein
MDQTAAEAFPALYRAILDGVSELEQAGLRTEALAIRRDATAAYSGTWAANGRRRLELLVKRVDRVLAAAAVPDPVPTATPPWLPAPGRERPAERPTISPGVAHLRKQLAEQP